MQEQKSRSSAVLQAYMDSTGLSVAEVAQRTGLSRAHIYYLLKGQHSVGFRAALAFRRGCGIELDRWGVEV